MPSKTEEKIRTLSLWLSILLLALHVSTSSSLHISHSIAVGGGFPLWSCLTYQLFHANIFHCLCNVWALMTICFLWHPRLRELLMAYLISVLYGFTLWLLPLSSSGPHILGLSAPIFAFLGLRSLSLPSLGQIMRYNLSVCLSNLFLALLASCMGSSLSWQAHTACYLMGLIISVLNKPIIKTH